jgi:hypothetical protein
MKVDEDTQLMLWAEFLLLMTVRQYSLRKRDNSTWEICAGFGQGENEVLFGDEEVCLAKDAGMLEMLGGEIVLGLSELGRDTLADLEKEQQIQREFFPPSAEPERPPTVH